MKVFDFILLSIFFTTTAHFVQYGMIHNKKRALRKKIWQFLSLSLAHLKNMVLLAPGYNENSNETGKHFESLMKLLFHRYGGS